MGWRWRSSIKIAPGLRLNLSHRSARLQIGASPLSASMPLIGGSRSKRITASLPGTGLSFVHILAPVAQPPRKRSRRKRGTYEIDPGIDLSELFVQCVMESASRLDPPIAVEAMAGMPADQLRILFKNAVWNLATLAGHNPEKDPFIITDALLAIDGMDADKLAAMAAECAAHLAPAPLAPPAGPVWTSSATPAYMVESAPAPETPAPKTGGGFAVDILLAMILVFGIILGIFMR